MKNINKCYRYEFVKDNENLGIFQGIEKYFTTDEIMDYCGLFYDNLKEPNIDFTNIKSFFTEKGNRKFRKIIRGISKIAESKGISVICIVNDIDKFNNIVYSDNYQVIVKDMAW